MPIYIEYKLALNYSMFFILVQLDLLIQSAIHTWDLYLAFNTGNHDQTVCGFGSAMLISINLFGLGSIFNFGSSVLARANSLYHDQRFYVAVSHRLGQDGE